MKTWLYICANKWAVCTLNPQTLRPESIANEVPLCKTENLQALDFGGAWSQRKSHEKEFFATDFDKKR